MKQVLLLRDFKEDGRISMEQYADQLEKHLSEQAGNELSISSYQPALSPWCKTLPGRFNLNMRMARYLNYPRQARRLKADIYHIVDQGYAHLMSNIPPEHTLVTVHDVIPLLAGRGIIRAAEVSRRSWLAEFTFKYLKRAAQLIAVSESTKKDLIEFCNCNPERIAVIPNGINPVFKPQSSEKKQITRKQLGFSDDYKVILIVGGSFYKNHPVSLKVLESLTQKFGDNIRLLRVGHATTDWTKALASSRFANQVKDISPVDTGQLINIYNAADCLLFPSLYEGFGWPPLEAMACGLPVVASNVSSLPDVVGDAAVTTDPNDVQGMDQAITRLFEDPDFYQAQTEKGFKQAAKFSWEENATRVHTLYERLAA